jgi:hypothetical protein
MRAISRTGEISQPRYVSHCGDVAAAISRTAEMSRPRYQAEPEERGYLCCVLYVFIPLIYDFRNETSDINQLVLILLKRPSFLEDEQWTSNRDGKPGRASRPLDARAPPRQCAGRQRSPALLTPCERLCKSCRRCSSPVQPQPRRPAGYCLGIRQPQTQTQAVAFV